METYQSFAEAAAAWAADAPNFEARGFTFEPGAEPSAYLPEPFRRNFAMAMDAQPALSTDPNSAVPALMTTFVDPTVTEVMFARLAAANIIGEQRTGDWVTETMMFPVVEHTGEVSSYGDYSMNGRADANVDWPNYQAYLFQTFVEIGDREVARFDAARINLVAEKNRAAATILNRAQNTIYHFGVAGLQNYGMTNDPALSAALTPATKANGGVSWFTSGGAVNASPTEAYNDILALYQELVTQTAGLVKMDDRMVLALPTNLQAALGFTNSFGQTLREQMKASFPNMRVEPDALLNAQNANNPTGIVGGNLIQLWAEEIEGQRVAVCAFNEKMRSHRVVMHESSYRQKKTSGAWGAIIRIPVGVAQMIGC